MIRTNIEKDLEQLVTLVEVWGQVAAFASDWFKETLVDIGALEFALDILYCLKMMVDTLDRLGIFEQWKLRRKELPKKDAATFEEVKEEEVLKKI